MAPLCKQAVYKSTGFRSNFLSLNLKLNHARATPLDQLASDHFGHLLSQAHSLLNEFSFISKFLSNWLAFAALAFLLSFLS